MNDKSLVFSGYEDVHPDSKEIPHFVLKLYRILETEKYSEYIRWNNTGESFVIPDGPLLAAVVLPNFYKSSTFTSFVRQLNIYGFRRITDARKAKNPPSQLASAFAHPNFCQGRVNKLHLIKRKVKRTFRAKCKDLPDLKGSIDHSSLIPINGLECSSSDTESSNEIEHSQTDHSENCHKCHSLIAEVQVLRSILHRYQRMEVSTVPQSLPYNLPMEYETHPSGCNEMSLNGVRYPMYSTEPAPLRLPNWSTEMSIPENSGYEVTSSELPSFFCQENSVPNYSSSMVWNTGPSNPPTQPYSDNIPTLSVALGWDSYTKSDHRESQAI
ncbi:hypothetical protein K7432_016163 [Basidiobolus ranarum]|uniref:HSF-type DNA-binding domain-containing protein n=1 Tax=Basidiobolus ranarum TaxID=34480 RepID=A0ABR2WF56_9FUNG